jgi:hypothetical protein
MSVYLNVSTHFPQPQAQYPLKGVASVHPSSLDSIKLFAWDDSLRPLILYSISISHFTVMKKILNLIFELDSSIHISTLVLLYFLGFGHLGCVYGVESAQ